MYQWDEAHSYLDVSISLSYHRHNLIEQSPNIGNHEQVTYPVMLNRVQTISRYSFTAINRITIPM